MGHCSGELYLTTLAAVKEARGVLSWHVVDPYAATALARGLAKRMHSFLPPH